MRGKAAGWAHVWALLVTPFAGRSSTEKRAEHAADDLTADLTADGAGRAFTHGIEQTSRFRLPRAA